MTLLPSDPLYPVWDALLTRRAALINAGCHFDLRDMPEVERLAMISELTDELRERWEELNR